MDITKLQTFGALAGFLAGAKRAAERTARAACGALVIVLVAGVGARFSLQDGIDPLRVAR